MQVEALSMRVWSLVVFVAWLVLVCILEIGGMGEHVTPLPPDPSLIPRLPPIPAKLAERLGPLSDYAAIGEHPTFAEDRKPHPFLLTGGTTQPAAIAARLTGVILTPGFNMATLTLGQNTSIRLRQGGDAVQGWRLLALEPRDATVEGPNGTQSLLLDVFDGKGGQPPTVLRNPPRRVMQFDSAISDGNKSMVGGQGQMTNSKGLSQVPVDAPYGPPSNEDQLRAIRERIEQRRQQLRQQQLQQQRTINGSTP